MHRKQVQDIKTGNGPVFFEEIEMNGFLFLTTHMWKQNDVPNIR